MLNSEPLMFIVSANTSIVNSNQQVFDSRYDVKKGTTQKDGAPPINLKIQEKISQLIKLRQTEKLVWCKIILNNVNYEGIPWEVKDENLVLKTTTTDVLIPIKDIIGVIILNIQESNNN